MHAAKYSLISALVAATTASHIPHRAEQGLAVPQIWSSPLFKSSAPSHGPSSAKESTLTQSFQLHEPAPLLTSSAHSCSVTLVSRSFANSYGSPSTLSFDPRTAFAGTACSDPDEWTGLTLDVHGETRGRQFDRLGTVWVGNNATGQGVEVLRLDNPEPTKQGVYWSTKKDVGKYWPLWSQPADLVFDLPNIVDDTYTGALNVTLKLTASVQGSLTRGRKRTHAGRIPALPLKQRTAHLVIPLSKRLQTGNSIFQLGGSAGNGTASVKVPHNAARALVEVYASGTAAEEFWYTGIPDRFFNQIPDAAANGYYGHGPYREVQLYIDGAFAGFVTPYPVIFTGGINPLLWRPAANYGTLDQPTYTIDVTPFIGTLTDDQPHSFELAVVGSERGGVINDASWFVSGNVQVYLDSSDGRTTGKVIKATQGAEVVKGTTGGGIKGDPLTNGSLTYSVGLQVPRRFDVAGSVKTGSGKEYVAAWSQQAEYDNRGLVNATTQTNDQKSFGWTRSLVVDARHIDKVMGTLDFDAIQTLADAQDAKVQVSAVQMDYNHPLYVTSSLSNTSFDARIIEQFDRTVRRTGRSTDKDLTKMVGDETTLVHADPVAALPHAILSKRNADADSVLVNGAIANGTGTARQTYMYRDMAGGTIDRVTRTNTTNVLQDSLAGSVSARAQPGQLTVA